MAFASPSAAVLEGSRSVSGNAVLGRPLTQGTVAREFQQRMDGMQDFDLSFVATNSTHRNPATSSIGL